MDSKKNARTFGIDEIQILVPGKGKCPICAAKHAAELPHNRNSLYYQIHFWQKRGRFPTAEDAAAHCGLAANKI